MGGRKTSGEVLDGKYLGRRLLLSLWTTYMRAALPDSTHID